MGWNSNQNNEIRPLKHLSISMFCASLPFSHSLIFFLSICLFDWHSFYFSTPYFDVSQFSPCLLSHHFLFSAYSRCKCALTEAQISTKHDHYETQNQCQHCWHCHKFFLRAMLFCLKQLCQLRIQATQAYFIANVHQVGLGLQWT